MPKEVVLCGFKVQVPLRPEDELQVEAIELGLRRLRERMKGTGAFFVPKELPPALAAIHSIVGSLLDASRVAAAQSSRTAKS